MTAKQIRFVKADKANPEQHIAEVAVFDEDGTPLDPPTSGGGDVADSSVTNTKLANNAVTEPKIASNAVTTPKIADSNVTTAKLAEKAVTAAKIADNVLPTNATKEKAGLVRQAAHVDGSDGTAIVTALVNAGIMAAS